MFNNIINEIKKNGVNNFEITVDMNNYIIRKLIEEKQNLELSRKNDKIKYAIKI